MRTTGTTETTVRFTIECTDARSGTTEDRLNQKAAQDLVMRCAVADLEFDLTVYNYMRKMLMLDDQEAARLKQAFPDCGSPQIFFAFDFERSGKVLGKCVLFLSRKSKQLGITPKELATKVITGIPEVGPLYKDAPIAWDRFMVSFRAEFGGEPSTECLNFDVVKLGNSSQVKIYVRLSKTSFNSVEYSTPSVDCSVCTTAPRWLSPPS